LANEKYDDAVQARQDKEDAIQNYDDSVNAYNDAVTAEATALEQLTLAQSAVDGQTVTVNLALEEKNNSQDALDLANINLQTAQLVVQNSGNQGWQFTAYTLNRSGNFAYAGTQYCSGVLTQSYQGMPICGRYENMFVVYSGKITAPEGVNNVSFAGYTDDGFRMYVDGQLVINQWQDQGATWSPYYYHTFTAEDRVIDVVFHYFNGGGPGVFHVGWGHSGIWTGVASSAMSYGQGATQAQIDSYNQALSDQQAAQEDYDSKLATYNSAVQNLTSLNQDLTNATQNLTTAQQNLTNALNAKNNALQDKENAEDNYDQAILDMQQAIINTREEYNKQWEFEEAQRVAAAIAQALANQPQPEPTPEPEPSPLPSPEPSQPEEPTPEPSSEPTPSPQPSPEQTEQDSPNPEPTDQTNGESNATPTPEPETTQEPQPEPSPQQTDIDPFPTPTPQPEPTLPEPSLEPTQDNNTTEDLTRVLANLTSKDNITVKLTPEQMAIVGQSLIALAPEAKVELAKDLGVKTDEIAILAEAAQDNPAVAAAIISFAEKAEENADAPMPYTIADAITEAAAELFLEDPLAVFAAVDLEELSDPSQWGKDMTDDQREKAQEVIVPVILVSNIVTSVASALSIRRI